MPETTYVYAVQAFNDLGVGTRSVVVEVVTLEEPTLLVIPPIDPKEDEELVTAKAVVGSGSQGSVSVSMAANVPTTGSVMYVILHDTDIPVTGLSWQWARSSNQSDGFTNIAHARRWSYTPTRADVGKYLHATATYEDAGGAGQTAEWVADCPAVAALDVSGVKRSFHLDCENGAVVGLWGDDTTLWVSDSIDSKVYAYSLPDVTYDPTKDFPLHADNVNAGDMWSDDTTLWVTDHGDDKLYAYRMSDGSPQPARDITLDADNADPRGVWSDGTTLWVSDDVGNKVYAYTLTNSGATRDSRRDFDLTSGNDFVRDLWSDGGTMWVTDYGDDKLYAYTLTDSGATYDSSRDISLHNGAAPGGIWSDGEEFWVADYNSESVHVYDLPETPGSVNVSMAANVPTTGSAMNANLDDPDTPITGLGWQWARSSRKTSGFTNIARATLSSYTPTSADVGKYLRATATYDDVKGTGRTAATVTECPAVAPLVQPGVNRSLPLHCENEFSVSLWSDETTMWVLDYTDQKVYAYSHTGAGVIYDPTQDFALHAGNTDPGDMWSDGTILWVTDSGDEKLYAYRLSDGSHQPTRDIALDSDNASPAGVWSDETTLWVADDGDDKVFAYLLTDSGAIRNAGRDFGLATGNTDVRGVWSDGTTLWVTDDSANKAYAYTLTNSGAAYDSSRDISLFNGASAIWSDIELWVADFLNGYVHVDDLLTDRPGTITVSRAEPPTVGSVMFATLHDSDVPISGRRWQWARSSSKSSGFADIAGARGNDYTPTSADVGKYLRVTATYDDVRGRGRTAKTVLGCPAAAATVLDVPGTRRSFHLYCENGAIVGLWGDDTTLWVSDAADKKVYAYRLSNLSRDSAKDFALGAGNDHVGDIWSNGTILWVTDHADGKLYAYRLRDGARQSARDLALASGNTDPHGVWSDGVNMWVSDAEDDKVYAYTLTNSGANRNAGRDFGLAPGNQDVRDLSSDGTTMWAVDVQDNKVYAYTLNSTGATYNSSRDISLFDGASAIWSHSSELWVADYSQMAVHVYHRLPDRPGKITVSGAEPPTVGSVMYATLHDSDTPISGRRWQWARSSNKSSGFTDIAGTGRNEYTPASADAGKYLRVTLTYDDDRGRGRTAQTVIDCPAVTATALDEPGVKRSFHLYCENGAIVGLWGNDTTLWVSDLTDKKVYAYRQDNLRRDEAKDFALHADNGSAGDMWSNGTILWVTDHNDDKLYAYRLRDGARQPARDIGLASGNGDPRGVWSDGTNMWVSDAEDDKVYAYTLTNSGANRNAGRDFGLAAGNTDVRDIWSDGTTMWAVDNADDKLYAYTLTNSGANYDSSRVVTLYDGAAPGGIWSDGSEIWVADFSQIAVHVYDKRRDRPGKITVSGAAPPTVGSQMFATLHDSDTPITGRSWQWARSSNKSSGFTNIAGARGNGYTPTSADVGKYLRVTLTYDDARGTGRTAQTVTECPSATPLASSGPNRSFHLSCENDFSVGLWGDDTTLWVSDLTDKKVYAYQLTDLLHDPQKDFALHADNNRAGDIWSNGTILWVTDYDDNKLYAYRMSDGSHLPGRDIALDAANTDPEGVWSDGTTMWVSDDGDEKVYAYTLTNNGANRNARRDFNLAPGHLSVRDIWSDGRTMWAVDVRDEKLYAYTLTSTGATYEPVLDLPLFAGLEARGIWSDGDVMWVADHSPTAIHEYDLPRHDNPGSVTVWYAEPPTVGSLIFVFLHDSDVPFGWSWEWARSSNKSSGFTDIASASGDGYTPTSADEGKYLRATVTYDDNEGTGKTAEWVSGCPVPASLEVPGARRSFRLHCDNDYSVGLWGDDTTLWVADFTNKVFAYNRSDLSYDSAKNFALHADNDHAGDLWSNGTILWVTDFVDDKLYAYRLSDGSHQSTRDIALDAANGHPEGVWSDGTTMWVADDRSNKVFAYTLTNYGAIRNATRDFNLAPGHLSVQDLWSDGTIMWVVDLDGDKLYAYRLNNSGATYEPALDLSLPASFGTRGIWSDGEVMWVADHNPSAVHDFDMPDIPGAVTVWFADPPTVGSGMIFDAA